MVRIPSQDLKAMIIFLVTQVLTASMAVLIMTRSMAVAIMTHCLVAVEMICSMGIAAMIMCKADRVTIRYMLAKAMIH